MACDGYQQKVEPVHLANASCETGMVHRSARRHFCLVSIL